ncbi:type II toxin-antitoxin system PemK/MazF family toxin [Desulfofundulus sp. TPOSR]|jgi:mRNA interferase MazF|nr:type II toxin-antitoxin system PemK/MazF family toxin [Desulfofundulus sp. TPOSR]NHM27708.1 type II toxin-antitoxin system PemK/MazF family toxin [Desulfofundulus sp. TPOSR]
MKQSTVNAAQVITIDKSCLVKKLGSLPKEKIIEVDRALKISLGLK